MLREHKLEGKRDRIEGRASFKNSKNREKYVTLSRTKIGILSLSNFVFLFSITRRESTIDDGLSTSKTYSRNSQVTSILTNGRLENTFDEVYY